MELGDILGVEVAGLFPRYCRPLRDSALGGKSLRLQEGILFEVNSFLG